MTPRKKDPASAAKSPIVPRAVPMATPRRMTVNREGVPEKVLHETPCRILAACGSCPVLDVDYRTTLVLKSTDLKNRLAQAGMSTVPVMDCNPSPERLSYRHTAKLVVSEEVHPTKGRFIRIGLYRPQSHEVIDIGKCPVQTEALNIVAGYLRYAFKEFDISIYNPRTRQGLIRYVVIRSSRQTKETLVTLVTSEDGKAKLRPLARDLREKIGFVKGVLEHINRSAGNEIFNPEDSLVTDTITGNVLLAGEDFLEDDLAGLNLKVSATSFFQVNPLVAEKLYFRIQELVSAHRGETILDLYCGVGAIALSLAQHAKSVIGIDETRSSIADAERNSRFNEINNAEFIAGRAEDILADILQKRHLKSIDVVTLNPSRRGCAPIVLEQVANLAPRAIVYMSCMPDTLIRDVNILASKGYKALFFEPYDMFPGTNHYEVLTLLERTP